MKQKIFYSLVIISFISIITSAKQAKCKYCNNIVRMIKVSDLQKTEHRELKSGIGFDLSPLQSFVLSF